MHLHLDTVFNTSGVDPCPTKISMKIAILVKDGMVQTVISDRPDVEVEVVDADFNCCNPMEKWNEVTEVPHYVVYSKPE